MKDQAENPSRKPKEILIDIIRRFVIAPSGVN
jgi:hypothetical protein